MGASHNCHAYAGGKLDLLMADGLCRTCQIAKAAGAIVVHTGRGRAAQMNAGAQAASGDRLLGPEYAKP